MAIIVVQLALAICRVHCDSRKPIILGFQSHREVRQCRHPLMDAVVAVEVLVDANFAGRVLLDLVMKILHRSTNRRASAQTKRF